MDFRGRYLIPAPPAVVWTALYDPDVLGACLPGCQALTRSGDDHFDATATLQIGPLKATFKAGITVAEMDPPHHFVLTVEAQGGAAGYARGDADVLLTPDGDGTVLTCSANATAGGKLAEIDPHTRNAAAKQIADEFFSRFTAIVAPSPVAGSGEPELAVAAPEIAADAAPALSAPDIKVEAGSRDGLAPEVWVVGLIGVIVILLLLFGVTL